MAKFGVGIICLVVISCLAVPCLATSYTVGDTGGWSLGVDYGTWATGKTFKAGDTLVFNYASSHTVSEVSESDYKACSASKPISTDNTGATSIPLKTAGKHYFICSVMGHCDGGMKLEVTVAAGGDDTPAATPSSGSTTTAPTSGAGTTVSQAPPTATTTTTNTTPHPTEFSFASTLSPFAAAFVTCAALIAKQVLS